jgi:hypothetical protein
MAIQKLKSTLSAPVASLPGSGKPAEGANGAAPNAEAVSIKAQVAAGEAFMAEYRQTFDALAK